MTFNLSQYGIDVPLVHRNTSVPQLYEIALRYEEGTSISNTGALMVYSGQKTGRSPKDKRIVRNQESEQHIDWGEINIELDEQTFMINRERGIDYLNTRKRLFVVDAFAGWDPTYRIKVRVICTRAYHALFMQNMLIMPSEEELENFGEPDYVIFKCWGLSRQPIYFEDDFKDEYWFVFGAKRDRHIGYGVCRGDEKRYFFCDELPHAASRRTSHALLCECWRAGRCEYSIWVVWNWKNYFERRSQAQVDRR